MKLRNLMLDKDEGLESIRIPGFQLWDIQTHFLTVRDTGVGGFNVSIPVKMIGRWSAFNKPGLKLLLIQYRGSTGH